MKIKRPGAKSELEEIRLNGVSENNLKGFDLALPRHGIVAVVGVSGSGKSSLLFQTIAPESLARHEAMASRPARLPQTRRPNCRRIQGLPFCITVSQRALQRNARSTVATFTGLHGLLRRLVIDEGEIRCECGALVPSPGPEQLVAYLSAKHAGATVKVSAVVARAPIRSMRKLEELLREHGSPTVGLQAEEGGPRRERRVLGLAGLDPNGVNAVSAPIGQHRLDAKERGALSASLAEAHRRGERGVLLAIVALRTGSAFELDTGLTWPCPNCHRLHQRPTTSLLSFNSVTERSGRCPRCEGLGAVDDVALEMLVPNPRLSIEQNCFALLHGRGSYTHLGIREDVVRGLCLEREQKLTTPFHRLNNDVQHALFFGTGDTRVQPIDASGKKSGPKVRYHGFVTTLRKLAVEDGPAAEYARSFVSTHACDACGGTRFENERLAAYHYRGRPFTALLLEPVGGAHSFVVEGLAGSVGNERDQLRLAARVLESLERAGLGYVQLNRSTSTLSGGELQRLKIAASLYGGVTRSCYVLDEPSLGLHPIDNQGLIETIRGLRDAGNTLLIADHDPDFVAAADIVVTLGPGAGSLGGELISVGTTPTSGEVATLHRARCNLDPKRRLQIHSITAHNLDNIDVDLPLGGLVCLTGISGSGKSTFAHKVLHPAVDAYLASRRTSGPTWRSLAGADAVRRIARVGQQPIGTSMSSVVATYLGVYDIIRARFAATEEARARGYTDAHFSFNRSEGRCAICSGRGVVATDDRAQDSIECPHCAGARFSDAILDIRWRDRSIADVLRLEAREAAEFFADTSTVASPLRYLVQFGIGHLQLGRPTPTLSGGEAQRLKLAESLIGLKDGEEGLIFILDEPTAGLHRSDVAALLDCFSRIIDGGRNTLVVIEHDIDVIAIADWIIDFGPGAGSQGGQVVYAGAPENAHLVSESRTGEALQRRGSPRAFDKQTRVSASNGGLLELAALPTDADEHTRRFLHALRGLDSHLPGPDDEERSQAVEPAYLLGSAESSFHPAATPLDVLLLKQRFYRLLLPHVRFISGEGVDNVHDIDAALQAARRHAGRPFVAFSPLTTLIESGDATRTNALQELRSCAKRGFEQFTIGGRAPQPIASASAKALRCADIFSVRVIVGAISGEDHADRALLERALSAGHGWATLVNRNRRGWSDEQHLASRPLSIEDRRVGRAILCPDFFDRWGGGGCVQCGGAGRLETYDPGLIVANRQRVPLSEGFLSAAAEELLRPLLVRIEKTFQIFGDEDIVDLRTSAARGAEWGVLCHGCPGVRFLIPGRSGAKNVDYYEWQGLFPLIRDRLHLSKNPGWRQRVEASRDDTTCFACDGSGFHWQVRRSTVFGRSVAEAIDTLSLSALVQLLLDAQPQPGDALVAEALADLVAVGAGDLAVGARCRDLPANAREKVRLVSLKYLRLAEATLYIEAKNSGTLEAARSTIAAAASDARVVLAAPRARGD